MADYLQKILGGAKSSAASVASDVDVDFADFATAASPIAPSHAAVPAAAPTDSVQLSAAGRPYTKWYRVWERATLTDFYQELVILPCLLVIVLINLWGSRANRQRAKQWAAVHLPLLESEFASIGFGGGRKGVSQKGVQDSGLAKAMAGSTEVPEGMLKEKSKAEYIIYATGRQNIAWLEIKISLYPRYNPFMWFGETLLSFFFDSMPAPTERLEATCFCFDGKEKSLIPMQTQGQNSPASKDSTFDGFVWAIAHKDRMKQLRDERYDLSLTATKDHPKLPSWATVMSESAEITEALLTPDLVKAVNDAGEDLEVLVVSDQPIDAPKKLNDTIPRKRVYISMKLNTRPSSTSLFSYFLRMPDHLVSTAHFRAEAMRKVRATREEEMRKIRKIDETEKAEDRRAQADKQKKEDRDRKLSKMGAEEQRKFLENEKKRDARKQMGKQTVRA